MKSSLLLLGVLALFTCSTLAEDHVRVRLDGSKVVSPKTPEEKEALAGLPKGNPSTLELYPTAKKPALGTVMVSPGGGYGGLAATHEGSNVAQMLNEAGWDAAVLFYHVSAGPTTRDLAIADAKQALALLQTRGTEFGLATNRVGAMGFSAGGHLTARLAHETADNHPPQFVVLIYPAYLNKGDKLVDEVPPAAAPAFLYVAANDGFRPGSDVYAAACKEKGIPYELHIAESGGHGFGLKKDLAEAVRDWPALLTKWLETYGVEKK